MEITCMHKLLGGLTALGLTLTATAPAFAGAVTGFTATDGFSSVPIPRGVSLIDTRVNYVGGALSPTLNVVLGVADGLELGIGSFLNVPATGGNMPPSIEMTYPWVRGGLPVTLNPALHFGYMLGADLPGYQAGSEEAVGATLLTDFNAGPLTVGLNTGYKRYLGTTGLSALAANLNFTRGLGAWTFYEENFLTARLGGTTDAGVRFSASYAITPDLIVDLTPAVLLSPTVAFNPNVGLEYVF
jgi:hypothetical protein